MRSRTHGNVPELVSGFLDQHLIRNKGLALTTREVYADSLILLLNYISEKEHKAPDHLEFSDFSYDSVCAFLNYLEHERGNAVQTRNLRLSALKSFFQYAALRQPVLLSQVAQLNLIPGKRYEKGTVDYLKVDEIQALLDMPDTTTIYGLRDRAMLLVTYVLGLRVSEALRLCISDFAFGPSATVIIYGKGAKTDTMPLLPRHVSALQEWLNVRPRTASQNMFVNRKGEPLSRDGFAYVLTKYAKKAGQAMNSITAKHVTPHVLRHSCAMAMLAATGDPRKAAKHLRHAGYGSIEIYLHADPKSKLRTMEALPALDIRAGNFGARAHSVMDALNAARKSRDLP